MNTPAFDRRALLRAALLLAAGSSLPGCAARAAQAGGRPTASALLEAVGERAAAAQLGAVWLRLHPQEADVAALIDAIVAAAPELARAVDPFAALAAAVRADYVAARCELVDDWLLSRTEARIYALATVSREEPPR